MQYSQFFGILVRENGIPNLSQSAYQRLMNIISLEGQIKGLHIAQQKIVETEPHKYQMEIFKKDKQLTLLTGNLKPSILLHELLGSQ